jgi:rhamnulokinase
MKKAAFRDIAIDIGASGGKMVRSAFDGHKLSFEDIYRFENRPILLNGSFYWNILSIFDSLIQGMRLLLKDVPVMSAGIAAWGSDFGFLDKNGRLMENVYHYRDVRTLGIPQEIFKIISNREVFFETGCVCERNFSLCQLYYIKTHSRWMLDNAECLLFVPDLLGYFLTGIKDVSEITIAGASQLMNSEMSNWAYRLFDRIALSYNYLNKLIKPGVVKGGVLPNVTDDIGGKKLDIIAVAGHDTASAVSVIPNDDTQKIYISAGTMIVLGIESKKPILNEKMLENNFKISSSVCDTYMIYRNITGFWIINECLNKWKAKGNIYSYPEIIQLAKNSEELKCFINIDDPLFFDKVDNMDLNIADYCRCSGQQIPSTVGEIIRCVLESYAMKIKQCIEVIREISAQTYDEVYLISGACRNDLFAQMIADATDLPVKAGLPDATLIGNSCMQLMAKREVNSLQQIREVVSDSFEFKQFGSQNSEKWQEGYLKARKIFN